MEIKRNIEFSYDREEAKKLQIQCANEIKVCSGNIAAKLIAGTDVSYNQHTKEAFAAVVVIDSETKEIVESASYIGKSDYPYRSGFLSVREAPSLFEAFRKLKTKPELIIVDGNGQIHPRRFGLACHIGLALDIPTIGCAKTPFVGEHEELPNTLFACTDLKDQGDIIGKVIRTQIDAPPIYISVGHKFNIDDAITVIKKFILKNNRHPIPVFQAHRLCAQIRKK